MEFEQTQSQPQQINELLFFSQNILTMQLFHQTKKSQAVISKHKQRTTSLR